MRIIHCNTLVYNSTQKRTMMTKAMQGTNRAGKYLYSECTEIIRNKVHLNSHICSNLSQLVAVIRKAEPIKGPMKPNFVDLRDDMEIMSPIDWSGQNHFYLAQWDSEDHEFVIVYGAFSTSNSPYNGVYPHFVDTTTIFGNNKYQYFHLYSKPKKIRRDSVEMDELASIIIHSGPYLAFVNKIRIDNNL